MRIFTYLFALVVFGALSMGSLFAQDNQKPDASAEKAESAKPAPKQAGLANPASVNCEKKGGKLEIRKGKKGEYGVCKFPNGKECEEWALFRGKCSPDADKAAPAPNPDQK